MKQNELIHAITKLIPNDTSLIDVIASVLDISYASAHRRVNNSAKLTIGEAVKLAKHFNLSLDKIFFINNKNIIPVTKTQITDKIEDIETYFKKTKEEFEPIAKLEKSSIILSNKDIPIAHYSKESNLSKFKIFVWLKLLNPNFKKRNYSDFKLSSSIKKEYYNLGELYEKLNVTEIWDTTTINSTLKQVLYYYSINQLQAEAALKICKELKLTILRLRKKATPESNYKLYYNELLLMENKMLVKTPTSSSLFIQFTAFNSFSTVDKDTCDHITDYLDRLLNDCKLINSSTEKEKNFFFNKMLKKIDSLIDHILGHRELDF